MIIKLPGAAHWRVLMGLPEGATVHINVAIPEY